MDIYCRNPLDSIGTITHLYDAVIGGCSLAGSVWVMLEQPGRFKIPALLIVGIQMLVRPVMKNCSFCESRSFFLISDSGIEKFDSQIGGTGMGLI